VPAAVVVPGNAITFAGVAHHVHVAVAIDNHAATPGGSTEPEAAASATASVAGLSATNQTGEIKTLGDAAPATPVTPQSAVFATVGALPR